MPVYKTRRISNTILFCFLFPFKNMYIFCFVIFYQKDQPFVIYEYISAIILMFRSARLYPLYVCIHFCCLDPPGFIHYMFAFILLFRSACLSPLYMCALFLLFRSARLHHVPVAVLMAPDSWESVRLHTDHLFIIIPT